MPPKSNVLQERLKADVTGRFTLWQLVQLKLNDERRSSLECDIVWVCYTDTHAGHPEESPKPMLVTHCGDVLVSGRKPGFLIGPLSFLDRSWTAGV